MRQQQRVERAIKQLASYGVPVGPAESAAGFTRGLDPDALQSAAHLLFRTPPPVLRADPKDLKGCGGVQLAQACAAQQQYDQGLVHVAESGRGAAELIGNLCEHTAAEVERIVSRFEDQVEQFRIALPECPPELLKAMGDSAQRAVCEQLERRNKALGEAADQLVADCEAAVAGGEGEVQLSTTDPAVLEAVNGQDVGGGHGEQPEQGGEVSSEGQDATPALGTDLPEHDGPGAEAAPVAETTQPQEAPSPEDDTAGSGHDVSANHGEGSAPTDSGEGQSRDDAPVVELETSGALPQDVEPAEVAAWSPDIWLAEGADTAQAEQASHASGDAAIGGVNGEPGGSPAVKPATTGITVERTYEVGIERSGQW